MKVIFNDISKRETNAKYVVSKDEKELLFLLNYNEYPVYRFSYDQSFISVSNLVNGNRVTLFRDSFIYNFDHVYMTIETVGEEIDRRLRLYDARVHNLTPWHHGDDTP